MYFLLSNKSIKIGTASAKYYPEAGLINIKTKGKITYPNMIFYKLISEVEDCFTKIINSPDIFEKTVDDLIDHYQTFQFPCPEHKYDILAFSIKHILSEYANEAVVKK